MKSMSEAAVRAWLDNHEPCDHFPRNYSTLFSDFVVQLGAFHYFGSCSSDYERRTHPIESLFRISPESFPEIATSISEIEMKFLPNETSFRHYHSIFFPETLIGMGTYANGVHIGANLTCSTMRPHQTASEA